MFLISISLINNCEHFICLFATLIVSLVMCLSKCFAYIFNWAVCFLINVLNWIPKSQFKKSQWGWRFPTPTINYQTSAGCWGIQWNSDTMCLETASDCKVYEFNSTRLPPHTHTHARTHLRHQPEAQVIWLPALLTNLPQIGGSNHHFQLRMTVTSPGCHLCFWPTSYTSEVPTTSSSGLRTCPECLTELREICYLLELDH